MTLFEVLNTGLIKTLLLIHRHSSRFRLICEEEGGLLRVAYPAFVELRRDALTHGSPEEIGQFYSVIHKATRAIAVFLIQSPTAACMRIYCEQWEAYLASRCPTIPTQHLSLHHFVTFIRTLREAAYLEQVNYEEREHALLPIRDEETYAKAENFLGTFTGPAFYAMMDTDYGAFHGHFSTSQFRGFLRGFGKEQMVWEGLPGAPLLNTEWQLRERTVVQFDINDTSLEYEVTGDPIDDTEFCRASSPPDDGTTCSICASDFEDLESTQSAVVTKCGHYYHFNCLNCWVNRSALPNSNTCPSCRTVLCKRRERVHVSQQNNTRGQDVEEVTESDG